MSLFPTLAGRPGAPTALVAHALAPGTLLGSVRVERQVARGRTATVYAATDAHDSLVALKALHVADDDAAAADDRRQAFLEAGERASRLEHPHVARVLGGGYTGGIAFLTMEWLSGCDLTRWTRPGRLLPEAVVLAIGADLADALAHAHRLGIVHRDVKPANAMFDPATQRVVLTDFGLARAADAQASRSGQMLGSPHYMAPELLAGAAPDARSDLYALGAMMFELLAGRPPFAAAGMGALLRAIAQDPPPRLAQLRPELEGAAALDELLAPLLAKEPADRASDAGAWAQQARLQRLWLTASPAS
jgi:serine/threonine protein kinase